MLNLIQQHDLKTSPGDFGMEVLGSDLLVSTALGTALGRMGITTGEEFFSVLSAAPDAFADLQPSESSLTKAVNAALDILRPAVAESLSGIDRQAQRSFTFGVPIPKP